VDARDAGAEGAVIALLGFELLRPEAFLGLAAALFVLAAGLFALARGSAERALLFGARAEELAGRAWSAGALASLACGVATAGCAAIALLGPARGSTSRPALAESIDVVVCVDTSRSMLARDLKPDRLGRALREIRGLLGVLEGDRVGVVAFSGDTRDVSPLTRDVATLDALLDNVSAEDNRMGGTDLGAALARALELFDGRTGAHEAIVLITDGEDLGGQGLEVAREAAARGIRVYVVGVGTAGGSKIPVRLADGSESFLRDREGQEVVSRLGGESLEAIAAAAGGEYLSTESSPTPLEDVYRLRIANLERRSVSGGAVSVPNDRYQWFLGAAAATFLAQLWLARAERRGVARARKVGGA
jgi:Ca-activated chloride channel family protein